MPKVYFIRHGQTEANVKGILTGRMETNLTQKGINDAKELLMLSDKEEIIKYIEEHKKSLTSAYDYNEKLFGYTRNGRVCLRFGDKIIVVCSGADPIKRQVDFTLVRKL